MSDAGFPPQPPPTEPAPFHPPVRYYPSPAAELKPISAWVWIGSIAGIIFCATILILCVRAWKSQTHVGSAVVDALHANMAQGNVAAIFTQSDPAYQHDVGLERSNRLFNLVHNQLGDPHTSFRVNSTVKTTPIGETLVLVNQTIFDKGTGTETITLHKVNGTYKLIGYYVKSTQVSGVPSDLKPASKTP